MPPLALMVSDDPIELDATWRRAFRRRLTAWYATNGRKLPWRLTHDPYRIWVSEVMLQQTTVAAVIPYFERFLARFPTVLTLAEAPEQDVLRLWEGLGYYSRALNMHATARHIIAEQRGAFPRTAAELAALRGIGRYTAGAIASFAFDEPAPIVEANTLRLYCRLIGFRGDPRTTVGQKRLWEFAERIVPKKQAGRFNQALMELGATVCTVKSPRCEQCPVRANCQSLMLGLQNQIPKPKTRPAVMDVTEAYIVVRRRAAYLLRRRTERERWAGLWDFPRCEISAEAAADCHVPIAGRNRQKTLPLADGISGSIRQNLETSVMHQTGVRSRLGEPFADLRHGVTRFRIRVICFHADYQSGRPANVETVRWVAPGQFGELALSRTGRRLADLLVE